MTEDDAPSRFVGTWWLPETAERPLWGELSLGNVIELNLFGSPDQIIPAWDDARDTEPPVMFGRSRGSCLTLLDGEVVSTAPAGPTADVAAARRLRFGMALVGPSHLATAESARFDRASFRLANLDAWVHRSPYRHTMAPTSSLQVLDLPDLRASVPGCDILLRRQLSGRAPAPAPTGYSSHESIELLLAEPLSIAELEYRFIRPLQQLVTLATRATSPIARILDLRVGHGPIPTGSIVQVDPWQSGSFAVRRAGVHNAPFDNAAFDDAVFDSARLDDGAAGPVRREHLRFGMNGPTVPPNVEFNAVVARWFALQEHLSTACDVAFSLRARSSTYLTQQLLTVASALECLHQRHFPDSDEALAEDGACRGRSYEARITVLLDDTAHLMATIVQDERRWARTLTAMRDTLRHGPASGDERSIRRMTAMLRSAQLLAEVVLLRWLGFGDADCRRMIKTTCDDVDVRRATWRGFPEWFTSAR